MKSIFLIGLFSLIITSVKELLYYYQMKLPKAYEPEQYEGDIYALWERSGAFTPKTGEKGYFSMAFPPPNANGNLHMGQALTTAVQDTLVRYNRMAGKSTLFLPGADHAGFETWVVYERKLNTEGKSRFDFNREDLYRQVWDFVAANRHNFESQLRALGGSFDWSKFTFTLDKKVVETTYRTFRKMWEEGLIYRGKRIVNFCTFHGTSFSDIEVVHEDEDTKLWHIAYPLVDGGGEVVIATTRPETKLGQAALMVNPKDDRYKNVVGKEVSQPLVPDKPIKIIADDYVDMGFGTGVVTVTPGHDPNDFEVAQRHDLPVTELITPEGKMSDNVPEAFRGLTISEARPAAVEALDKAGYLRGVEDYRHSVAKCYKCGTTIEPLVREQWFVKMRPLADRAVEELKKDKIKFHPLSKKQQLIAYLSEVKDWNISRQIAWGIPIPAFQNVADEKDWIFDERVNQETIEREGTTYRRDPDVFDTWFSSGQWPLVTLNYPDGDEFKDYYPLSLMETGSDILFPWVSRMIMLGLYITDEVPFREVYLHGLVLAEDGKKKMSKSLGNVVNPMDIIAQYGSDALRMGLLSGRRAGVNQGWHPAKIVGGRNFANKLWNIARFTENMVEGRAAELEALSTADHWIARQAASTADGMAKALDNYRLSEAYELLYQFVWGDLADWYIEASKVSPNPALLAGLLERALKLAHPFAPFVTETIWQTLDWQKDSLLASQPWPEPISYNAKAAADFQDMTEIITEARKINTALKAGRPTLFYRGKPLTVDNAGLISHLAGIGNVALSPNPKTQGIRINKVGYDIWLDINVEMMRSYIDRLIEQKAGHRASIERLEGRLASGSYVHKAPARVVEQSRAQLAEEKELLSQLDNEIAAFTNLVQQV